jgi:hypothetical protein
VHYTITIDKNCEGLWTFDIEVSNAGNSEEIGFADEDFVITFSVDFYSGCGWDEGTFVKYRFLLAGFILSYISPIYFTFLINRMYIYHNGRSYSFMEITDISFDHS